MDRRLAAIFAVDVVGYSRLMEADETGTLAALKSLRKNLITPPVGMNLFVIKGIAKAPMADVVRGIVPYVGLMLLGMALMLLFPGLSTWLPATMGYGR